MFIIGQIVFSTSPQEHYFDCPFQLSSEAAGQTFLDATVLNYSVPLEHSIIPSILDGEAIVCVVVENCR